MTAPYTPAEDQTIRDCLAAGMTALQAVAAMLEKHGRKTTPALLRDRMERLGLNQKFTRTKHPREWSDENLQSLKALWNSKTTAELAIHFGVSEAAIVGRGRAMGLPKRRSVYAYNPTAHRAPLRGGLHGEDRAARDRRVLEYVAAHPDLTRSEVALALGVPVSLAAAMINLSKTARRKVPVFMPPQLFTPGPKCAETPIDRIAAIPANDLADIAARYGAAVPDVSRRA